MARKELLHIVRDPRSLMAALTQPVLILLLFGYALSLDVDRIPTMIYDADRSAVSQNLVQEFRGSRYFQVVDEVDSYEPIERAMDQRRILVGVAIPYDYSRNLLAGQGIAGADSAGRKRFQYGFDRAWATRRAWSKPTRSTRAKMPKACARAACSSRP